jgi:hypothetical protein
VRFARLRSFLFPEQPEGGMTYANWRFGIESISEVSCTFHLDNDPGPKSDLYLQLYDASIDGTGTYHGVQTINLVIFSRFGTVDRAEVRPAAGAYSVSGTSEGPFVSLRMEYSIGPGSYRSVLRRGEPDGAGDWFDLSIARAGDGSWDETPVGAIRFPRRNPEVPATLADGGGSWTEFWDNNGPVLRPVPLWQLRIDPPLANGEVPAEGVTLHYSRMPNSVITWDEVSRQVMTTIGGGTRRTVEGARSYRIR